VETLTSDVRYALRSLLKSKLFTAVALVSLALGIGANVTVFSVVNAMAFKALPYVEPDRLVDLHESSATQLCEDCGVGTSFQGFTDWRAMARSFSGMAAYLERPFSVSGTESAERVGGALISAEAFDVLGIQPAVGRGFVADDDRIGAAPVVIIGDGLWARRYGADKRVVGQTIRVNGVGHTVIGVMPPRFRFPEFADLWVPLNPNATGFARDQRDFGVVARLKPGVSRATADAEMLVIGRQLEKQYPETQKEWQARASRLRHSFGAIPESMYGVMLGAVGFVLLIVCANLAGLLLARGTNRQREIAIRLALGGTRWQIVRHLLTESLLLSLAGGALGLLLSQWGVDAAIGAIRTQIPFYVDFGIDRATLAYSLGLTMLTSLLFGLMPSMRASRPDVHTTLKETSTTVRRSYTRGMLVIGELALSLILLAGAGVLMKSVARVSAPGTGTDEIDLLTGGWEFLDAKYNDRAIVRAAVDEIVDRLDRAPGVTDVSAHGVVFVRGFGAGAGQPIRAEGADSSVVPSVSPTFAFVVTPTYFSTVRLAVLNGRKFDSQDRAGTMPVAMINKHMAEVLWPGQSPIGRKIKLGSSDTLRWLTVVGVTNDIVGRDRISNFAYLPFEQATTDRVTLMLRSDGDPARLIPTVRAATRAADPDLPILNLQTVREQRRNNYWPYQMYTVTVVIFAGFAVLLAAVGLYGVIAYNTAMRTRELGVRIALGAEARDVFRLVAREGGRLVVVGIVLGLGGSVVLLRALRAMMFGASTLDIPVFAAVSALLAIVAFAAIWAPARQAARISPLEALRAE
jgi:putative ABC transport system permease protein